MKKQGRTSLLETALSIVRLMQERHVRPTGPELAAMLGCSERNARRWLRACYDAGIPMPPTYDPWEHSA